MDGSLYRGNIRSKEIQGLKKTKKERRKEKALGGTKGGKTRFHERESSHKRESENVIDW